MSEIVVKKYVVRLTAEERTRLDEVISKGKRRATMILKARILLKADISDAGEGWSDGRIVRALNTSLATVHRTRQCLVEEGLEAALARKPRARPSIPLIFDGEKEARLITLACSKPPPGHAKWSLRLLEQKVVELGIVTKLFGDFGKSLDCKFTEIFPVCRYASPAFERGLLFLGLHSPDRLTTRRDANHRASQRLAPTALCRRECRESDRNDSACGLIDVKAGIGEPNVEEDLSSPAGAN
jgi:hypothetical protein